MAIDPVALNLLVEEVLVHSNLALSSYSGLESLVSNAATRQHRHCWAAIQSFLGHSAMVAKFVDPPKKTVASKARAKAIMDALSIPSSSYVFNRDARNNVEHLDERLDDWIQAGPGNMLEVVLEDREGFEYITRPRSLGAGSSSFIKRVFIIEDGAFITQGRNGVEEIDLRKMKDALDQIAVTAETFLADDQSVTRIYPK